MARLTIEEYLSECGPDDWPVRVSNRPDVLSAFMIPFSAPAFLAGPFGGKYGLVTIRDGRKGPNRLCTQTEAYNRVRARAANSLHNMPRTKSGQAGLTTNHEFISGRYDKDTLAPVPEDVRENSVFFMTRNTLPGSATLEHPHLCVSDATSGEIDGLDLLRLFRKMTEELAPEDIIRRIDEASERIEKSVRSYLENEADAEMTVERPILLRLCGNDDFSWGRTFPGFDEAMAFAEELETWASPTFVYREMKFTN